MKNYKFDFQVSYAKTQQKERATPVRKVNFDHPSFINKLPLENTIYRLSINHLFARSQKTTNENVHITLNTLQDTHGTNCQRCWTKILEFAIIFVAKFEVNVKFAGSYRAFGSKSRAVN